jgi:putative hemolysin
MKGTLIPVLHVSLELLVILCLVLINGVFASSELALVSARRARLQQQADSGSAGARVALDLSDTPNRYLSTINLGLTVIGILTGVFGGATLAVSISRWLADVRYIGGYSGAISILLVVALTTYLTMVIGELAPKRLGLRYPEVISVRVARPMRALSVIAAPVVTLLSVSTDAVLRLLRVDPSAGVPVTEEDVKHMIHEGARAGVFEASERDMVVSIFRLGDRDAGSLMTPRHLLVYLDVNQPDSDALAKIAEHQYTLFPVCKNDLDHVLGVVTVKTLWTQFVSHGSIDLHEAMVPALFVPESMPVLRLTELFRSSGNHKALVIDEYGVLQGLVTMTDVLEAIVGDLDVGPAPEEPPVVRRADGTWLIDGMLSTDGVETALGAGIFPVAERDYYDTLGGFLMARLGRVPAVTDSVEWRGWRFEVVDMDGHRVDKVLVSAGDAIDVDEIG